MPPSARCSAVPSGALYPFNLLTVTVPLAGRLTLLHYISIKGTVCNFLGNLLSKINIFIHKYVLSGVQIPLPII